jgi:hypothetical protein
MRIQGVCVVCVVCVVIIARKGLGGAHLWHQAIGRQPSQLRRKTFPAVAVNELAHALVELVHDACLVALGLRAHRVHHPAVQKSFYNNLK